MSTYSTLLTERACIQRGAVLKITTNRPRC